MFFHSPSKRGFFRSKIASILKLMFAQDHAIESSKAKSIWQVLPSGRVHISSLSPRTREQATQLLLRTRANADLPAAVRHRDPSQ